MTQEIEDNVKFRMSVDLARRTKDSPKLKFTVMGNTKEEFEANFNYLSDFAGKHGGF